jgi:diketogulonate reductase-like aldo/keto reductase
VALAFVVRRPGVYTIPKAAKREHVEDNAAALGLELDAEEIALLEDSLPLGPPMSGLPFL